MKKTTFVEKINNLLTGFRTVLLAWAGYGLVFLDAAVTNLAGLNGQAAKGAAVVAFLVTLKQIKTDILPKLRGKLGQ
jgi:hypothetical protein